MSTPAFREAEQEPLRGPVNTLEAAVPRRVEADEPGMARHEYFIRVSP